MSLNSGVGGPELWGRGARTLGQVPDSWGRGTPEIWDTFNTDNHLKQSGMVVNGILSTNVADIGQKVSTLLLNISVTGFRLIGVPEFRGR